jgi:ABC-type nitrate/sulfonate/bicarbonate transport system permease component
VNDRRVVFAEAVVLFLVVWEVGARAFDLTVILASPLIVWGTLEGVLATGEWIPHFVASVRRILWGFSASVVLGVGLGVLLGVSEFWRAALRFYVLVGMALPGLLVVIFSAMWFGISDATPMVAAALLTTPFVIDIVQSGIDDIDSRLVTMSGAFDVSRRRVYRRVLLPSILPELFASVRFAFSVAWKVAMLAEVVISNVGVGFVIREEMSDLAMDGVLAYLALFVVAMLLVEYGLFRQVERRVFDWRDDVKGSFSGGAA